nr:AAA family ATPase [Streptomyces sp. SID7834]
MRARGANAAVAYEESQQKPKEIIPDLLSATTTNLAGRTTVGKSWFASYLAARMVRGEQVAGRDVADRVWRPLILGTDSDPKSEYSERIRSVLTKEESENVFILPMNAVKASRTWEAVHYIMKADGYNFLIVDNLTQIIGGDTNSDALTAEYYDSMKMFNENTWPVLTLTHQSEKGWGESKTHKGSSNIAISARHNLYAYKEGRKLFISTQTNVNGAEDRRLTFLAKPGANFDLIEEITEHERLQRKEERKVQAAKAKEEREVKTKARVATKKAQDAATANRNRELAQFVVSHYQGQEKAPSKTAVARELVGKFPDGNENSYKVALSSSQGFGALLSWDANGRPTLK